MPNKKISELDPANPLSTGGQVELLQSGGNFRFDLAGELRKKRDVTSASASVQTDDNGLIIFNSGSPLNFTLDQLAADTKISFLNIGAGAVTFVDGSGVTHSGSSTLSAAAGTSYPTAFVIYHTSTTPRVVVGSSGSGTGDVVGPGSATDGQPVLFDGTTGKLIKTGDVPLSGIVPASAASKLLGRGDSGAGDFEEVTLGTNLSMSGTTLNASGGGGGGTWGSITGTLSSQTDLQTALDGKQPIDSDLTAIAGLSPSNDDIIQRKAGAWTNRTMAQLASDLGFINSRTNISVSGTGASGTATLDWASAPSKFFDIGTTIDTATVNTVTFTISNITNLLDGALTCRITGAVNFVFTNPSSHSVIMNTYEKRNARWVDSTNTLTLTGITASAFILTFYKDSAGTPNIWVFASDPGI